MFGSASYFKRNEERYGRVVEYIVGGKETIKGETTIFLVKDKDSIGVFQTMLTDPTRKLDKK